MSVVALADTNLLLYCYDRSNPVKYEYALAAMDQLEYAGAGALSTQVLGEFLINVTRKPAVPLPLEAALDEVGRYLRSWVVFDVTTTVVKQAVRAVRQHRLNYWDAQIWAVAFVHQIPFVFSEDFQTGRVLEGVRFLNPLRPDFHAAELVRLMR